MNERRRPANFIDILGQRFGRLRVLAFAESVSGTAFWKCVCDCGAVKSISGRYLRAGLTRSCGCLQKEINRARLTTHGQSDTVEFIIWWAMINRCENRNFVGWQYYGGRNIKVCERWRHSFANFLADMGRRPGPGYSLDRYPDNDGNYEPGNVRWATRLQQNRNRRPYRRRRPRIIRAISRPVIRPRLIREISRPRIIREAA